MHVGSNPAIGAKGNNAFLDIPTLDIGEIQRVVHHTVLMLL
jgi:hypothetical protein